MAASEGRGRDGREDGRGVEELRKHQQRPVRDHSLVVESKSPTPASCEGNCSVVQCVVKGIHGIVAVVLRYRYGLPWML